MSTHYCFSLNNVLKLKEGKKTLHVFVKKKIKHITYSLRPKINFVLARSICPKISVVLYFQRSIN